MYLAESNSSEKSENDVTDTEIYLRIYKKTGVNLTLIDLPGLVSNIDNTQHKKLPQKIERIIEAYAQSKETLILIVVPGNVDAATWKARDFASRFDTTGERTLGVITKVDVDTFGERDPALYVRGMEYQLKNGYVAVKCRSHFQSENGVTLEESLAEEKDFFKRSENFEDIASTQGIEYLRIRLKELLSEYINRCLPDIVSKLTILMDNTKNNLVRLGDNIVFKDGNDARRVIQNIILRFCK